MGTYFSPSASLLLEMMAALTVSVIYILNIHTHICIYVCGYTAENIFQPILDFLKSQL